MSRDVTHVTTCQQFMTHKYTFYRHFFFVPLSFEIHHTRTCQSLYEASQLQLQKSHDICVAAYIMPRTLSQC